MFNLDYYIYSERQFLEKIENIFRKKGQQLIVWLPEPSLLQVIGDTILLT